MKLSYVLLLSLVAAVIAEHPAEDYYSQQAAAPSNYYAPRRRQSSGLAGLVKRLFAGDENRRQLGTGTGGGTGFGGGGGGFLPAVGGGGGGLFNAGNIASVLLPLLLLGFGAALLVAALASLDFNSSGRGLDTDDWEVDHSVWMNQLQKDFEDSWSTE